MARLSPDSTDVLHMLRSIMNDPTTGDQPFIAMMRDFVKTHFNKNASTESFKRVVEKHMTKNMDFDGNGKMDWFFDQWVYGTEVPSYRLDYSLTPQSDGKWLLKGAVAQSGVSDNFKMGIYLTQVLGNSPYMLWSSVARVAVPPTSDL